MINQLYQQIRTEILNPVENPGNAILASHEAATKLWVTHVCNKEAEEIDRRIANLFIAVCHVAHAFDRNDLEKIILVRMQELKNQIRSAHEPTYSSH